MRQRLPAEGALTAKLERWRLPCRSIGNFGVTGKWVWMKQSKRAQFGDALLSVYHLLFGLLLCLAIHLISSLIWD